MSLTLTKKPADLELIDNDLNFIIKSDSYIETAGVKAFLALKFTAGAAVGEGFYLTINGTDYLFQAVTTPDDSGFQFTAYTSGTLNGWVAQLAAELNLNSLLDAGYTIVSNNEYINILAREEGDIYNISLSSTHYAGVSSASVVLGVNEKVKDFYRINAKVYLSATDELLGELSRPVNDDGEATFNVAELLKSLSDDIFEQPQTSQLIYVRTEYYNPYYIKYYESYVDSSKILNKSPVLYWHPGGLAWESITSLNDNSETFLHWLYTNRKFLTHTANNKRVRTSTPERLYWLHPGPKILNLKVMVEVTTNEGTTVTSNPATYGAAVDLYKTFEIITTYNKLLALVAVPSGETIISYKVWLADQLGNRITEYRNYIVDYHAWEYPRTFFYRNSYNVWDTLLSLGVVENTNLYDGIEINQFTDIEPTSEDYQQSKNIEWEQQTYKASTGWLSKKEIDGLRDFILSLKLYELIDQKLYPIVLTTKTVVKNKDDEYLHALLFTYKRAYTDIHYSNLEPGDIQFSGDDFSGDDFVVDDAQEAEIILPANEVSKSETADEDSEISETSPVIKII